MPTISKVPTGNRTELVRGSTPMVAFKASRSSKKTRGVKVRRGIFGASGRCTRDQMVLLAVRTVTIYTVDNSINDDPCSATATLEFASVAICYNTSWTYYSIDFCTSPNELPQSSPPPSPPSHHSNRAATIASGVLGGLGGLAVLVAAAALLLSWDRRRRGQCARQDSTSKLDAPHEVLGEAVHQLTSQEKKAPVELYAQHDAAEMDWASSANGEQPMPVTELAGQELGAERLP